jgi:hypothetical protein
MYYDLAKKRYQDKEKEKVPRSLQYPERLSENAKFEVELILSNGEISLCPSAHL